MCFVQFSQHEWAWTLSVIFSAQWWQGELQSIGKEQKCNRLKLLSENILFFFKIYLFTCREGKGGREENINVWLPLTCPLLGTWPATQAFALTGNWTNDPLVRRPVLNPLSYTSQGSIAIFQEYSPKPTLPFFQ